jgi:hypothetical protein
MSKVNFFKGIKIQDIQANKLEELTLDYARQIIMDLYTQGVVVKGGVPSFGLSVNGINNTTIDVGLGEGFVNGNLIQIKENQIFTPTNTLQNSDGEYLPLQNTGNVSIPLANYTAGTTNYFWIEPVDLVDGNYWVWNPLSSTSQKHYPKVENGYKILVNESEIYYLINEDFLDYPIGNFDTNQYWTVTHDSWYESPSILPGGLLYLGKYVQLTWNSSNFSGKAIVEVKFKMNLLTDWGCVRLYLRCYDYILYLFRSNPSYSNFLELKDELAQKNLFTLDSSSLLYDTFYVLKLVFSEKYIKFYIDDTLWATAVVNTHLKFQLFPFIINYEYEYEEASMTIDYINVISDLSMTPVSGNKLNLGYVKANGPGGNLTGLINMEGVTQFVRKVTV